jgi:membrane protein
MKITDSVFVKRVIENEKAGFLLVIARVAILFGKIFRERRMPVLAQSLAYTTIFTLVPILAAFFSILGFVAGSEERKIQIKTFIAQYFFPEYVNTIFDQFEKITVASTVFGVIGFPTLFLAGVFLYVKVYSSINEIWLSEMKSTWFKNFMSFFMTLFFGPVILVLVFSIPPYLQTIPYYQAFASFLQLETLITQLVPILVIFVGLLVLYLYIPVIKVRISAAVKGAIFAALVIQASNYLVSFYLRSFAKLDVIYGSLAIFPIFLLWVFIIWIVILSGAALAFIFHYHSHTGYRDIKGMYNDQSLLSSALQVMVYLVQCFQKKNSAPDFDQIQVRLGMNRKRLAHILNTLQNAELVIKFDNLQSGRHKAICYQPGIAPEKTRLQDLIPLFYDPKDLTVFEEDLNQLLKNLDIHPGFLLENTTLQDFLTNPGTILNQIKSTIGNAENNANSDFEKVD